MLIRHRITHSHIIISDCQAIKGDRGFTGTTSTTKKGYTCQRWDTQEPISHTHNAESNDASYFPEDTLAEASNYCRNPDSDSGGLWCYVVDGGTDKWDYCDVPQCCKL